MTADRPWPGEPGVPLHPEMDGWHWAEPCSGAKPIPIHWCVNSFYRGMWAIREAVFSAPDFAARGWRYLAPCILPSGLAAERAAAAEAMREACAQAAYEVGAGWFDQRTYAAQSIEQAIRALTIPASDALAAAVEAARREGNAEMRRVLWCVLRAVGDSVIVLPPHVRDAFDGVLECHEDIATGGMVYRAIRARSGGKEG